MGKIAWMRDAAVPHPLSWLLSLSLWAAVSVLAQAPPWLLWTAPALFLCALSGMRHGARSGLQVGLYGGVLSLVGAVQAEDGRGMSVLSVAALSLPAAGALAGWLHDQARLRADAAQALRSFGARTREGGMWGFRADTDALWVSEGLARLLGLETDSLPTTLDGWLARVHPEDQRDVRDELEALQRGARATRTFTHRVRRGDGSWGFLQTIATARKEPRSCEVTAFSEALSPKAEAAWPWFADPLTGLPNRRLFLDRLKQAVARRKRPPLSPLALLRVQLEPVDALVDEHTSRVGDEILARIAERLEGAVRQGDTVARLSGLEFGIILERVEGEADVERLCDQIARAVAAPIWLCGRELRVHASIGAVLVPNGLTSPQSLVRQAEVARELAARKTSPDERRVLFDALGPSEWGTRLPFDTLLRDALNRGDVKVHYQPIVELAQRRIVGFEALLRWQDPSVGPLLPAEIIAGAEDAGLIGELDDFVLERACETLVALRHRTNQPLYVSVNVSTQDLEAGTLAVRVEQALARASLPANALALELRESALMDEARVTQASLDKLRALGVQLHMDDFGTGYSSLSYLHRVSLDALKIDASCVRELRNGDDEIVRTAVTLGRALSLRIMAEGVETEAELDALARLGCSEAQGYLFGAPLPSHELEALLRRSDRFQTGSSAP